ncbi:MAG: peptide chain release factor N(5)-glutamine methyltransferase [Alphaproteobacteria bacterium HGW-Alphaproteobacteria-2]|nr:MAG: peptide chain release factor N(5)-glutamine methyltransferase [Alphaproteobacteria bacterium HGW-Alphaproteobacteria-2]
MSAALPAAAALADAAARLRAAGVPEAVADARRLLAHALAIAPERLTLALSEPLPEAAAARFAAFVAARAARQPVAQITGERLFWGRTFQVTPDVLDPRPETETLVATALEAPFSRVLDLGTGSGCLLLTLLADRPGATGLGTDISATALAVAARNAARLGLGARAAFALADWFSGVDGAFDLIVANPPYIAAGELAALAPEVRNWEPRAALTPGEDGLAAYRAIAAGATAHLAPAGRLILETGAGQGAAVAALCEAAGLGHAMLRADMDGRARAVLCMLPPPARF